MQNVSIARSGFERKNVSNIKNCDTLFMSFRNTSICRWCGVRI